MSDHDPFQAADDTEDDEPRGKDHLSGMSVRELRNMASDLGLKDDGYRKDLIARIRANQRPDDA